MHNLPVPAESPTYELQPDGSLQAISHPPSYTSGDTDRYPVDSTQGFNPNSNQAYSTVCVHVRESSFVASSDPSASCAHNAYNRAPMLTARGGGAGGMVPPSTVPGAGKRRMPIGPLGLWLCVLQLAVIIWLLSGHTLQVDCAAISNLKEAIAASTGHRLSFINETLPAGFGLSFGRPELEKDTKLSQHKGKHKDKIAHAGKAHQSTGFGGFRWPTTQAFVPPPPPSIPQSKLMVPPPPVAYQLSTKSPGAVAASTLPEGAQAISAASESAKSSESQHPTSTESSHDDWAAGANIDSEPPVAAAQAQTHPQQQTQAHKAQASTVAIAQEATPPPQPSPPAARQTPVQQPAIRTVMSGRRKRIIADR